MVNETQDEDPATSWDRAKVCHDTPTTQISLNRTMLLKPIYRKFESLNNRALLHLQGEIRSLEVQLQNVDQEIVGIDTPGELGAISSDPDSDMSGRLRWQRMELMRQILTNLEQYSRSVFPSNPNLLNIIRSSLVIIQQSISAP